MASRNGELDGVRQWTRIDPVEWLTSVEGADGCWLWPGGVDESNYGVTWYDGRKWRVHRLAYVLRVGSIPEGLELDHLCHTRAVERGLCAGGPSCSHRPCGRWDHLEVTSHRVNSLRGMSPMAEFARRDECDDGHPFSGDNLFIRANGARGCRECQRRWGRDYWRRQNWGVGVAP